MGSIGVTAAVHLYMSGHGIIVFKMEKLVLNVDGMSCEHCAGAVKNAVAGIPGTGDISVNLKEGTVSFSYDPDKAPLDHIKAAITEEGFTVRQ